MSRQGQDAAATLRSKVTDAAMAFERRWTMSALRRHDEHLYKLLREQQGLYHDALASGDVGEIQEQGPAMIRGWNAAVRSMEGYTAPDAVMLGKTENGTLVAIGAQKASEGLIGMAVFLTPDEVAELLEASPDFHALALLKRNFPGAELVDIRAPHPDPRSV